MKHTWRKTAAFIMALMLVAAPLTQAGDMGGFFGGTSITASAAETIDSGTKGSLSWTLDDEGTLFISGSGEVPYKAFFNAKWGNATKVKKIVTDESSTISKLNGMSYACYSSNTPLSEVEINTTVPLTLANNAFVYRSNNAVNYTINAPEITEIGQDMIYDYSNNAVNMVFNVENPIKFYKGTFTKLNSSSSFTIPAGSVIYIPAGYVFTDSYYQEDFNMFTNNGTRDVDEFFRSHSYLTEGVDYTYNEEAQEILLTADNTNQVFGNSSVTFYDILSADNVDISDLTYNGTAQSPVLKYGDTTLVKDTDYELVTTEGDTASATNAGTYTIHINGINDYAGENVELSWKINKADVNVTADAKSRKYGETDPPLTYTADDLFGNDTFTGALTRAEGETVDTYAITQGTLSAGDNYNINFTGANFTITKADASPDAVTGLTADYGSTLADVTLPDGWAWDAPATSVGNVGNNTFSATFTPANPNYNTYTTDLTVTVTAIPATPAAVAALNATYGDTLANVALPTVDGGTWAWKDVDTASVGNVGTQTFTAVYTPDSANYTAVEQDVTVNVAKADPTPDAVTGLSAAYGKTLADVTLPSGWTWNDDTLTVGNVGDNAFAATYTPDDTANYNTVQDNLTVTVVPVEKTALNDAITAANTYYETIKDNADYATPVAALSDAITAANAVYANDNVTEAEVAQAITDVNNAVTTAKAAVKDIDDTKVAQAVTDQISALPAAADITSADKAAVDAARAAYDALTDEQKALVDADTLAKLTAAETALVVAKVVKNTSTISKATIAVGSELTITGSAKGGDGSYKFAYYVKKSTDTKWTKLAEENGSAYVTAASQKFIPDEVGTYNIRVNVKDSLSTRSTKDFTLKVKDFLNDSTISSASVKSGETVTLNGAAAGGKGSYKFAYYYKKSTDSAWTKLAEENGSAYVAATSQEFKPEDTGIYYIRINVKDGSDTRIIKDFTLTVDAVENNSTISAATVTAGETVTMNGAAESGKGPYTFAYYAKKSTDSKWTKLAEENGSAYVAAASQEFKPTEAGTYNLRINVKDSTGTKITKDFTLTVEEAAQKTFTINSDESAAEAKSLTITYTPGQKWKEIDLPDGWSLDGWDQWGDKALISSGDWFIMDGDYYVVRAGDVIDETLNYFLYLD